MAGTRVGPPIETWETLAWDIYTAIEKARERRGKAAAAQLATKALEAISAREDFECTHTSETQSQQTV